DIIVGTPIAGREHQELSNQIGFYVNTLALRTRLNEEDTFQSLLAKIKQHTLDAFDHQAYPFDQLVNELDMIKDQSRNPLFEVMLVLQNAIDEAAYELQHAVEGIKIEEYPTGHVVSKFDLTLSFEERKGLKAKLEYNSDLFSE